jgi:type IV pilus secretin PilQ/predicted competence protein
MIRRPRLVLPFVLAFVLAAPLLAQTTSPLVTLNVRDESVASVLQALATQHRISLIAGEQATGKVTINLYDVPLEDAVRQILSTQGLELLRQDNLWRVLTADQWQAQQKALDAIGTRVYTLNHLTTAEAAKLVQPLLSTDGKIAGSEGDSGAAAGSSGGTTTGGSGRRMQLVVKDRQSVLDALGRTFAELDRPPPQVLLEATILSIDLGEDNRLGVDLNVLGGIDFDGAGTTSDLTGLSGFAASGGQLENTLLNGSTNGFAGPPGQGLAFGFLRNNVAAFVDALERTTNASIVSNPRVLALNGQEAKIIVGGRLGYTTVTQSQTSTIETVEFLETGTQLMFRPWVGEDGWIRMEVHPQNSAGVIDPVSGVPSESTTEITTRILMRDGQTLILGGLIGESISTDRDQVPLLGSLPLVGWLFGRTTESVTRRELVILLTPHILDPVAAERKAMATRDRFAAVRRSHWDSLSPYLRPVLAARWAADAAALHGRGELHRALGAVERSLALDPTAADAAVLRDELLQALALANLTGDEAASALELLRTLPAGPTPTTGGGK